MKTIVEPMEIIDKTWGKQKVKEDATYRLMKYVLRVDHEDKVLLHNVVTGRLVVLDDGEAEALGELPTPYVPVLEPLVTGHYLVPVDYDEYLQVINLRHILQKLEEAREEKGIIVHYTILPTTACNARCYYCFEQGTKPVTMTEQTANDVVEFIKRHSGGKSVLLSWFGGEPTLAVERIDQICRGLQGLGMEYKSEITTNGYLFDEETARKAKELWHLVSAMICVDGTEETYNQTKCFIYKDSNAYQVVMRNIGLLLDQDIRVHLRMNFDVGNYQEFTDLVQEANERFFQFSKLTITAHPVIGEYRDKTGNVNHGSFEWFECKYGELNEIAKDEGFQNRKRTLPSLDYRPCMAASDNAITITAEGKLVSCPQQFGEEEWKGNLQDGITNVALEKAWKEHVVLEKCLDCISFPDCVLMKRCQNSGNCIGRETIVSAQMNSMVCSYEEWLTQSDNS